jgi:myo-inositol 2-dehydrogenase/D-chiro-inositol 1-dehydrogenase
LKKPMKPIRVALIGLGRAGQFHLQSLRSMEGMQLVSVVDHDANLANEVASRHHCSAHTQLESALDDPELEAVIIASPTGAHYEQILMALRAGKAVLTEKPLGENIEQIRACYQQARQAECSLLVGFNRRFDPTFASLASQVRQGQIGTPMLVRITSRDSPLPSMDYLKTSHGIFHDCLVHDLDMLRFVTGQDPIEVHAMGSNFVADIASIGDLDNVLLSLRYESGMLASIDANRFACYGYDQRIEAFGSLGMLQAENRSATSTALSSADGVQRPVIEHSFPSRYREAYLQELVAFEQAIRRPDTCPITEEDVTTSHRLCDAALESYKLGQPVSV